MSVEIDRPEGDTTAPSGDNPKRRQLKSQKLDRTLAELECAFADWESLGTEGTGTENTASRIATSTKAPATGPDDSGIGTEEFRKKTKKLLNQLREQLSELND